MNRLIIIGAGGHGKVVADNALKNGYININFVDDNVADSCMGFPVVGTIAEIEKLNDGKTDFIIGIGNNEMRKKLSEKFKLNWTTLIHPNAVIASNVTVGVGTVIMAGAIVNTCSAIGDHCIINTASVVEHDNVIENYVHISPKAVLGGNVYIGENTHIAIGATVRNNIKIVRDCIIGAGAVVVKNIENSGTYVGVPARKLVN